MILPDISDIITFVAIYIIVWWLVFFTALPIGIKPQEKSGVEEGNDPGAPSNPNLKPKIIGASVVALIITSIITYMQIEVWQ